MNDPQNTGPKQVTGSTWADVVRGLPVWAISISLGGIFLVLLFATFSDRQRNIGLLGSFGPLDPVQANVFFSSKVSRIEPNRFPRDSQQLLSHDLNAVPDIVQVWTSVSPDGPWELVDSVLPDGNISEGIWVVGANEQSLKLNIGQVGAHSTHGNPTNFGWAIYGHSYRQYDQNRVWIRVSLIAFCIEEGDCP